jgi:hypothetical protein
VRLEGFILRINRSATGQSCASPPVNRMAMRRPLASASAYLRVTPFARAANSLLLLLPFPPAAERRALTSVESIICVSVDRPFPASRRNRLSQTPRRAQLTKRLYGRTIAPATTAFQYVHNAADDATVVRSFNPSHVRRQVRFDPLPLLIAQPK